MLEQLNGPASIFESNDCAFSPSHTSEASQLGKALQCAGRVMILFRELRKNLSQIQIEGATNDLHAHLAGIDKDFQWGMIGTTIAPTRYIALPAAPTQLGHQLMISFWAWGNSETEVMSNLERVPKKFGQGGHVATDLTPTILTTSSHRLWAGQGQSQARLHQAHICEALALPPALVDHRRSNWA